MMQNENTHRKNVELICINKTKMLSLNVIKTNEMCCKCCCLTVCRHVFTDPQSVIVILWGICHQVEIQRTMVLVNWHCASGGKGKRAKKKNNRWDEVRTELILQERSTNDNSVRSTKTIYLDWVLLEAVGVYYFIIATASMLFWCPCGTVSTLFVCNKYVLNPNLQPMTHP